MKLLTSLCAALLLLFIGAGTAMAVDTGTPAWATTTVTLLDGPGAAYELGGTIDAGDRIRVDRCQKLWCKVHMGSVRGWMELRYVAFGLVARGPLTGPRLNYPTGGPGTACLYTGAHMSGSKVCGGSGFVMRDLGPVTLDNSIRSISVTGNVSVMVCRDRFYRSYCQRFIADAHTLPGLLSGTISSFRVY